MTMTQLEREIFSHLQSLALPQQREVLTFVRTLAGTPVGVPGKALLSFAGIFDRNELAALEQAIDEDCEQVDADEW